MANKRVLIIDDSAIVRNSLSEIINKEPGLEVMGTAADPYFAAEKIKKSVPDVVTLDIEMPRMDGITFLRTLMSQCPVPVVIISSLTQKGTETALQALKFGAVEILSKPKMYGLGKDVEENHIKIVTAIKAAAHANVKRRSAVRKETGNKLKAEPKHSSDAVLKAGTTNRSMAKTTDKIVVIGASTGGTEALRSILVKLPYDAPPTAVVQHMPENFTRSFAESLNNICKVTVKEAKDGDSLIRGTVLIAPGNRHMLIKRSGARYYASVQDGPLVNRHRPSVDVLFRSAANFAGKNCKAIILTGMGDDGARGMLELKNVGAMTYAQDEKSCVVFGMPKEAISLGGVDRVLPLMDLHKVIV